MIAGHYAGCCCAWPSREVYYILNIAHLFPLPWRLLLCTAGEQTGLARRLSASHAEGYYDGMYEEQVGLTDDWLRLPQTGHPLCLPAD